jgi:hypothetical protein
MWPLEGSHDLRDARGEFLDECEALPRRVEMKAKRLALILALASLSSTASATLFCYNSDYGVGIEWTAGRLIYTNAAGMVITEGGPGQDLNPDPASYIYCWADGQELGYLKKNFPALHFRVMNSIQNPSDPTQYWTGSEALFIWNNL